MNFALKLMCLCACLLALTSRAVAQSDGLSNAIGGAAIGAILLGTTTETRNTTRRAVVAPNRDRAQNLAIQNDLNTLGYYNGTVDGLIGAASRAAIREFQRAAGFAVTGKLTADQETALAARARGETLTFDPGQKAELQRNLSLLGFNAGPPDGVIGRNTMRALSSFRASVGAPQVAKASREDLYLTRQRLASAAVQSAASGALTGQARRRTAQANTNARRATTAQMSDNASPAVVTAMSDSVQPSTVQAPSQLPQVASASPSRTNPLPSRAFAGPTQYPPRGYRGYGIVAFKSGVSQRFDRERHLMICDAYVGSVPQTKTLPAPVPDQFLTIWPVNTPGIAGVLNQLGNSRDPIICEKAIDEYNQVTALYALDAAKAAGFDDQGVGPFLLAWSPADSYGRTDTFVLALDLSNVDTFEEAKALFAEWKSDIEGDFELLSKGFSISRLKVKIRRWADKRGNAVLRLYSKGN